MSSTSHSPFYVVQEFLSPLQCEKVIELLNLSVPDCDKDDKPVKTIRTSDFAQEIVFERLEALIPDIEQHYSLVYKGTETMNFEWYPTGSGQQAPECGNSKFLRSKWLKVFDRDLTGIVYLSDYQDTAPLDPSYEVYGGRLEFPQHNFSFNPQRGTLVLFPSYPHFMTVQTQVDFGNLHLVRFHIAAGKTWLYDPKKFPGDFTSWFEEIS